MPCCRCADGICDLAAAEAHKLKGSCAGVAVAFLPYALYVLWAVHPGKAVSVGWLSSALALAPVVLCDRVFYGQWTVRLVHLLQSSCT